MHTLYHINMNKSNTKAELDRILSEDANTQFQVELELSLFWSMFFAVGVLGAELSFVRSVYKILG